MITQTKAIEAIRLVRQEQRKHFDKIVHCREYNMKLQEVLHSEMEKELGNIAMHLEILFNTGYIGPQ